MVISSQIWQDLNQIWWDLARSGQIPANFGFFFFLQNPVTFCIFWRIFADFCDFYQQPTTIRTWNWLDWLLLAVGFWSLRLPTDDGGSGPKPNRRHPWTNLISPYELLVQDIESTHFFCISWPSSLTILHLCFYFSKLASYLAESLKILKYKNQACPKIFGLADPLNSKVFFQILNLKLILRLVSSSKCIHNNNNNNNDKP